MLLFLLCNPPQTCSCRFPPTTPEYLPPRLFITFLILKFVFVCRRDVNNKCRCSLLLTTSECLTRCFLTFVFVFVLGLGGVFDSRTEHE
jgi:hypothetical protein